jgi:hypothetical protein
MKKLLVSAVVAVSAFVGSVLPSAAVTTIGPGGTWPTFPVVGPDAGFFQAVVTGGFSHSYFLNTSIAATLETTSASNSSEAIAGFAMQLVNLATNLVIGFDNTPEDGNALFFSVPNLAAGNYRLDVFGIGLFEPFTSAAYSGNVQLSFPPGQNEPTPLPGALVLMATALLGGAGAAKWRKRRAAS